MPEPGTGDMPPQSQPEVSAKKPDIRGAVIREGLRRTVFGKESAKPTTQESLDKAKAAWEDFYKDKKMLPGEQAVVDMIIAAGGMPKKHDQLTSEKQHMQKETFNVDGLNVDVNYRTLVPRNAESNKNTKPNTDSVIVVFPGWAMDADSNSAATIGQAFADAGNKQVLVVDTQPDKIVEDTLFKEAGAVKNLVKNAGAKNITLAGYSEGGIKAVDLATMLQEDPDVNVDGVVLMDSMGLYDQKSRGEFVGKFVKDTFVGTPTNIRRQLRQPGSLHRVGSALQHGTDTIFGMINDARKSKLQYPQRVKSQIDEMFGKSARLTDLRVPVILVQGKEDPVSNPENVLPGYERLDDQTLGYGKTDPDGKISERLTHSIYNPLREKFLKDNLFPNSPYVRMLVGKKEETVPHHVFPVQNAGEIATASLYSIERSKRENGAVGLTPPKP